MEATVQYIQSGEDRVLTSFLISFFDLSPIEYFGKTFKTKSQNMMNIIRLVEGIV